MIELYKLKEPLLFRQNLSPGLAGIPTVCNDGTGIRTESLTNP